MVSPQAPASGTYHCRAGSPYPAMFGSTAAFGDPALQGGPDRSYSGVRTSPQLGKRLRAVATESLGSSLVALLGPNSRLRRGPAFRLLVLEVVLPPAERQVGVIRH